MMNLIQNLKKTQQASYQLMSLDTEAKNRLLEDIILQLQKNRSRIVSQNKSDVATAKKKNRNEAFLYKLTLDEKVFDQMLNQVQQVIKLPDPVGRTIEERVLQNNAKLIKTSVPIGVIGIIYEARPSVTVDVVTLCIKSGNCVVLKGGSDALETNKLIYECIHKALLKNNLPVRFVSFIDSIDRSLVDELIKQDDYIDLIIPRGGYELVNKVQRNSTVPVLSHSAGGARIFVDQSADLELALKVLINSKVSRPGACNALDTIILHNKLAEKFLPKLIRELHNQKVETCLSPDLIHFDEKSKLATEEELQREKLALEVNIISVSKIDIAINHIHTYTKKHSEGIISSNKNNIEKFTNSIDAAAVFVNCATSLHDGGVFGLGAEMGIATGKIHARGPVGLQELTSYKWVMYGDGQTRA